MQLRGLPKLSFPIVITCSATGIWLPTFVTAGQLPEQDREHVTFKKQEKASKVWKIKANFH